MVSNYILRLPVWISVDHHLDGITDAGLSRFERFQGLLQGVMVRYQAFDVNFPRCD